LPVGLHHRPAAAAPPLASRDRNYELAAGPAVAEGVQARRGPVERQGLLDVDVQRSAFAISWMRVVSVSRFGTAMTVVR